MAVCFEFVQLNKSGRHDAPLHLALLRIDGKWVGEMTYVDGAVTEVEVFCIDKFLESAFVLSMIYRNMIHPIP